VTKTKALLLCGVVCPSSVHIGYLISACVFAWAVKQSVGMITSPPPFSLSASSQASSPPPTAQYTSGAALSSHDHDHAFVDLLPNTAACPGSESSGGGAGTKDFGEEMVCGRSKGGRRS